MTPPPFRHIWIVGPGRLGLALGLLLRSSASPPRLTYTGRRAGAVSDHPLFRLAGRSAVIYETDFEPGEPPPDGIVLAVPDAAIAEVASRVAAARPIAGTPVLHLSGILGCEVLQPLADVGCEVGSLHPLAAVPDSEAGDQRLLGAWFSVEGSAAARRLAEYLVFTAGGHLLPVEPGGKPLYHTAAVFASNFVVVLLDTAERLMGEAGVPRAAARRALVSLASGAITNVAEGRRSHALTGPISRGDGTTVEEHLRRLSDRDRALYLSLAAGALDLARRQGLSAEQADRVAQILGKHE